MEHLRSAAIRHIGALFQKNHPVAVATSFGKDSSVLLALTFEAALLAKSEGVSPKIIATTSDTGIENPEMAGYMRREAEKSVLFAEANGIDYWHYWAEPLLNDTFAVRLIGGRALPSFPESNTDCAMDWKIRPQARLRKQILQTGKNGLQTEAVTLVGTRFRESAVRARRMQNRGDCAERPYRNKDGDLVMSPIADWDSDDIWEYVGLVCNGLLRTYSDFQDLIRLYRDAGGTTCAVVSDMLTEGIEQTRSGCGARFGCGCCLKTGRADKSLETLIAQNVNRYGYLEPWVRLRTFLLNTQWDFSRRIWIGRSIDEYGYIRIQPDAYSPSMQLDLLRFCLTIDQEEREAAHDAGLASPRFQIVPLKALVAIDYGWSAQGFHRPFQAIREWYEIVVQEKRYDVPEEPVHLRRPMPETRYLYVGKDWDEGISWVSGLREVALDMVREPGMGGCMDNRLLSNGHVVLDINTEDNFDVDIEGAALALDFERDYMLAVNAEASPSKGLTEGALWWLRMGVVSLSPGQIATHHRILARTGFKERHGLAGAFCDLDEVITRSEPLRLSRRLQLLRVWSHEDIDKIFTGS